MAIEKVINLVVKTEGQEKLQKDTTKLNESISKTEKGNKDVGKSMDQNTEKTKKLGSSTSGLTGKLDAMTGGAISGFKGMLTGLGGVATGFKGVGTAIALSGLGLLVITIAAITAAFKASEEGQNKFAKLMGVIGSITGNLIDLLSDLGEKIIWAFENPKKAIEDFADLVKENIINRFEGILEYIPQMAKAVKQLFQGDFSGAAETAGNAMGKVALGVDNVSDKLAGLVKGTKEYAKQLADDAAAAARIADKRAQADKIERALKIEAAQQEGTIAELKLKARDLENYSAEERKAALIEARGMQDALLDKEEVYLALRRDAIKEENTLSKSNKDAKNAEADAEVALLNLTSRKAEQRRSLLREMNTINGELRAKDKAAASEAAAAAKVEFDKAQAIIKEEAKTEEERLNAIAKLKQDYILKIEDLEDTTEIQKLERQRKRALEELDLLKASEEEKAGIRLFYQQKITGEVTKIAKEDADEQIEIDQKVADAKADIQASNLNNISGGIAILKQLAGKSKALQAAGIIAESAMGIAKVVISTQAANAAATAKYALIPGGIALAAAEITANNISAGIGIGANVIATTQALSALGGGSAPGGKSPTTRSNQASAPQFNVVGQNPNNQLTQSINNSQSKPIESYVVSGNVTTSQNLNRNRVRTATFG